MSYVVLTDFFKRGKQGFPRVLPTYTWFSAEAKRYTLPMDWLNENGIPFYVCCIGFTILTISAFVENAEMVSVENYIDVGDIMGNLTILFSKCFQFFPIFQKYFFLHWKLWKIWNFWKNWKKLKEVLKVLKMLKTDWKSWISWILGHVGNTLSQIILLTIDCLRDSWLTGSSQAGALSGCCVTSLKRRNLANPPDID